MNNVYSLNTQERMLGIFSTLETIGEKLHSLIGRPVDEENWIEQLKKAFSDPLVMSVIFLDSSSGYSFQVCREILDPVDSGEDDKFSVEKNFLKDYEEMKSNQKEFRDVLKEVHSGAAENLETLFVECMKPWKPGWNVLFTDKDLDLLNDKMGRLNTGIRVCEAIAVVKKGLDSNQIDQIDPELN